VNRLYRVTFDDFCDWYLEAIKPRLYEKDEDAQATSLAALDRLLKLLHPVMPHVTEEIWSNLPDRPSRLIVAEWPGADPSYSESGDALLRVQDAAAIFRRSQVLVELDPEERRIFESVVRPERVKANGNAELEIDRLRKEVERSQKLLGNERFVANAAPEVVDAEREKLERYERELRALEGSQA
jgi:valyl-tRNA synthetase